MYAVDRNVTVIQIERCQCSIHEFNVKTKQNKTKKCHDRNRTVDRVQATQLTEVTIIMFAKMELKRRLIEQSNRLHLHDNKFHNL